jgi:hypothetical protein
MNQSAKLRILFLSLLLLLACASFGKTKTLALQGTITDSQCAFNVHSKDGSHDVMIKAGLGGSTDKSCTLRCAKEMGGKYVFAVKNQIYRLDDQTELEKFAGEKVKVTGTLVDPKTNTLHIVSIEAIKETK